MTVRSARRSRGNVSRPIIGTRLPVQSNRSKGQWLIRRKEERKQKWWLQHCGFRRRLFIKKKSSEAVSCELQKKLSQCLLCTTSQPLHAAVTHKSSDPYNVLCYRVVSRNGVRPQTQKSKSSTGGSPRLSNITFIICLG